jgi:hypothetical protein
MKKLSICIIDLIHNAPANELYQRLVFSSIMSIMPQVIGVWCKQMGHKVHYVLYGGRTNIIKQIPDNLDLVFISSFTYTAQLAYAISNMIRSKGIVTILGGPHARCYPEDSCKYFDYVIGLTDKDMIYDILRDCSQNHSPGIYLSSNKQPRSLPTVEERWEFIEKGLNNAPVIKLVPMLSSFGCPYKCDFCIDSAIPFQQLDIDSVKEDLKFVLSKFKRPRIGWYDPNFGIRFNSVMNAIEETVPRNSIDFIAECNLSILTESNTLRLRKNGFISIISGIESWYGYGKKMGTDNIKGYEKVKQASDQLNMIQRIIPYVNVNFILGLDVDQGPEPFELTKSFLDMTPGVYPAYLLLSAYGGGAPANIEYQRENRVIPFPFHVHRSVHTMNIRPGNYTWLEFYDYMIDLLKYSFSTRSMYRRFRAIKSTIPKWLILAQSVSIGGYGKISYHSEIRNRLRTDNQFRRFFEQETLEIPEFFKKIVQKDLGPLWPWLPKGAMEHDPNAHLKSFV